MKSEWLRWDLHVHTPESFEHNFTFENSEEAEKYNGDIFEKYIDVLEEMIEVECIGITDYFSLDGYKRIYQARKDGRLQNFKLILPNIEFRLRHVLEIGPDRKSKKINFHVIFSDELEPEIIENEFLTCLSFFDNRNSKHSLRKDNLIKFGSVMQSIQQEFKSMSAYAAGCVNAAVELEDIVKILEEKHSIFKGKYLLVLAAENVSRIAWGSQGDNIRRQLMDHADAMFTSNEKDRDFLLGRKGENFRQEFGKLWPVIHGSDAHEFSKIFSPDMNRFCWIKAQPTFEGLKQIVYEPADRVSIGSEQPSFTQYGYAIDNIKISESKLNDNLSIDNTNLSLSRGLVTVIGGKGSGKTALLDLLAHVFQNRLALNMPESEKISSFVARNTKGKSIPNLEISLDFADQTSFSKQMRDAAFHRAGITYLSQGKIDEFSNDAAKLQDKIRNIIFDKIRYFKRELIDEYEKVQNEINNVVQRLNEGFADLKTTYFEISQLDIEVIDDTLISKAASIRYIEIEIQNLLNKSQQSKEKYDDILNRQNIFSNLIQKYRNTKRTLDSFSNKVKNLYSLRNESQKINKTLRELGITKLLPDMNLDEIVLHIEQLDKVLEGLIQHNENNLEAVRQEVEVMSNEKVKVDDLQKRKGIELNALQETKSQKERYIENLNSVERKRSIQYKNIVELFGLQNDLKACYDQIIFSYSENLPDILKGIDFSARVSIDFDKWADDISSLFDSRKGITFDTIKNNLERLEEEYKNPSENNIREICEAIIKESKSLRKGKSISDIESRLYDPPIGITTNISYMGIDMDNLSMGQRGTVLLSIYLADGDNTLVIDQPEENLDNKYIYNVLVGAIKKAKLGRQIIIATHNANLVVNTDAEQIIIAEFKDNKISYTSGSIEDPKTRGEIALILEGGEEAFAKREIRYNSR